MFHECRTETDDYLTDLAEEYLLTERKNKDFYDSSYTIKRDFLQWLFKKFLEEKKMNKWLLILLAIVALCGIGYVLDNSPVWHKIIHTQCHH